MAESNAEGARRMIEALNRGELDSWAGELHEEIVWVPLAENPQTEPVRGVDDVVAFLSDWIEPWDEYTADVTRIVEKGDRLFLASRQTARREGGAEITMDMYAAATYRDGQLIECRWFLDEADALRAAGIEG
jgi:ketosteroid isomerase-like protein